MNNKCFYLVEGACERQLINALKAEPARLIPGSIIVHNVVQKTIPKAYVASFGRNSFVTMVFDTDIQVPGFLITCENPYMKPFFGCAHLYGDFSCRPPHMRKEEKSSFSNKGGRNLQMSLHFPPIDISRLEEDAGKCLFQATFQRLSVKVIGSRSFAY